MRCGIALLLVLFCSVPAHSQPGKIQQFEVTIQNLTNFDLSPGGYVIHDASYSLFRVNALATDPIRSLCESGTTPDFLYYVRKADSKSHISAALSFDGGAPSRASAHLRIQASRQFPLISFVHKVNFTDDTCVGALNIPLFDRDGSPSVQSFDVSAFDAGTRQNWHIEPPKAGMLAQFNWALWKESDQSIPQEIIQRSPLFGDRKLAHITIRPVD